MKFSLDAPNRPCYDALYHGQTASLQLFLLPAQLPPPVTGAWHAGWRLKERETAFLNRYKRGVTAAFFY
jgi:hypothetical protein